MKRHLVLFLALAMVGLTAAASYAEKEKGDSGRLLLGKVLDQSDNPVSGAIVYLSNTRTQTVKTYIVSQDGGYRFPALSPNIDYEVYAQYKGHKSDTKTVSQFDNRQQVNIVLKIDVR
jgi:Carboxypeptidase regulatory-like domain